MGHASYLETEHEGKAECGTESCSDAAAGSVTSRNVVVCKVIFIVLHFYSSLVLNWCGIVTHHYPFGHKTRLQNISFNPSNVVQLK